MTNIALKPLKLRQASTSKGLQMLLTLIVVLAMMIVTTRMQGQAPFALAIMLGSISLGYVIGGFSFSRRPHVIVDADGLYCKTVGRLIPWANIKQLTLNNQTIEAEIIEGARSWILLIDLSDLRLKPDDRVVLSKWVEGHAPICVPSVKAEPLHHTTTEYSMPMSAAEYANIGVLTAVFLALALVWMAWTIPLAGLVFAPFGLILGILASTTFVFLRLTPLRAVYHSLWLDAVRSIPWNAVQVIKLSANKQSIQVDLHGGCYQGRDRTLESPLMIDISKSVATGDEVLAGLNRVFRPELEEQISTPKEFVPNTFSRLDLYFSAVTFFVLVSWGGFGIWSDDLAMPARRGTLHLHGLSAWLMYAAWLLAAISFASIIIDHYDKRNNENRYKRIQLQVTLAAWVLFFASLATNLVQGADNKKLACNTVILKGVDSPDARHTAYAFLLQCGERPPEVVNISVIEKGKMLPVKRGNSAYISWPKKFSDVRWKNNVVQVVHAYPWKLQPVKNSPVAVYGVAR